ncbi:hypothetical protein HOD65_00520, partial [bacterium]|nr:hypothetical protein [bacterium]
SALFFTLFYYILNKLNIKKPEIWLFILLFSSSLFLFRLQLARPLLFTLSLSIIGIYIILKQKKWLLLLWPILFILSSYGSIFIISIIVGSYLLTKLVIEKRIDWQIILITMSGCILGLLFHPETSNFVNLIINNYTSGLSSFNNLNILIPIELENLNFLALLVTSLPIFLLIISLITLFLLKIFFKVEIELKNKINYYFLLLLSLIFIMLTIKYNRFIEYLAPILILSVAYIYKISMNIPEINEYIKKIYNKLNNLSFKLIITLTTLSLIFLPLKQIYTDYKTTNSIETFKETAIWLNKNTPSESIVFNTSWDAFPRLFFYNHHNYYVVGLDPIFLYNYNNKMYYLWHNISTKQCALDSKIDECPENKKTAKAIADSILNSFNSEYIWLSKINKSYLKLSNILNNNSDYFELMIETNDSIVYKIN